MARKLTTIEKETSKTESYLRKLNVKCELLSTKLKALPNQSQEFQSQQIVQDFQNSGKITQELISFLYDQI